jgi:hypothetical protein
MNAQPDASTVERRISPAKLWFGLLGGAFAWLAHLLVAYGVAEFGCVGGTDASQPLGISLVAWIVLALSALTFAVAAAAAIMAYHVGSQLARLESSPSVSVSEGKLYAAKAGWLTSGLFALVIAVETLPIFYFLQDC